LILDSVVLTVVVVAVTFVAVVNIIAWIILRDTPE
jgi:hypothetical protein